MAVSFGVDEIVLPDVIGDANGTIYATQTFLGGYRERLYKANIERMFVVQGQNYSECCRTIAWAYAHGIRTFGIPRHLLETTKDLMIRFRLTEYIHAAWNNSTIHFLGASPLWSRELQVAGHFLKGKVRGMDTSMPYVYAIGAQPVEGDAKIKRQRDYFDVPNVYQYWAEHNVQTMIGWAEDAWAS
jgi:hypothetical protein